VAMKKIPYIAVMLLAVALVCPAQEAEEKHLDIIFIIDASGSMRFTDPDEFRKVAVKAFIDITQDRGGDRIAVLQFAGWNETSEKGAELFPLTKIPSNATERDELLSKIKEAVTTGVTGFGKGTDFNFAFEKALPPVLEDRKKAGTSNKAWVILLTDGTTDVKEGGNTRREYVEAAGEKASESRKALSDAAQKYFEQKVLPQLVGQDDIFITCINLTEDEPSPELKLLEGKAGAKVLRTTREALKGIFVEALSSLPKGAYRSDLTKGFNYTKSEAIKGEDAKFKFRIYEGARVTRALIFSNTSDFTLDLVNQEGKSISDPWSIKLSGAGESYRVISITNNPAGNYTLTATNKSEADAVFETLFFTQFDLKPEVKILNKGGELHAGETLEFKISLLHKGKPINDDNFFKDLEAEFQIGWSKTSATAGTAAMTSGESVTQSKVEIPEGTLPGKYRIRLSFKGIKNTISNDFAFASPEVYAEFTVAEKPVVVAEKPEEKETPPDEPPPPPPEPQEKEVPPEPEAPPPAVEEKPSEPEPPIEEPEKERDPLPEPETPEKTTPEPPEEPEPVSSPEEETGTQEKPPTEAPIKKPAAKVQSDEEKAFPYWLLAVGGAALLALIAAVAFLLIPRKPKGPTLEFTDHQLWSRSGDARLLCDFGDGCEVTGTPEIPDAIVFRLTGASESPKCMVKPGPSGKIYIDGKEVKEWIEVCHNTAIEIEAAGRPEAPIYKYTYFERDPSGFERNKATHTVKKVKREDSVKPEDIFPTDVLRKEDTQGDIEPPDGDDELLIFDDD